jgi:hypothetical protein
MTMYRVLRKRIVGDPADGNETFALLGDVEASGAKQAIRQVVLAAYGPAEDLLGMYVAVPASRWTEESVAVSRPEPRIVIGGELQPAHAQVALEEMLAEVEEDEK